MTSVVIWIGLVSVGLLLAYIVRQDARHFGGPRRRVTGHVVGHRSSIDEGMTYYTAKVRFQTDDGRTVEIVDSYGGGRPSPRVGAPLTVVYRIDAPQTGRVPHPIARTVVYVFLLGTLAIFGGIAIGWLK